MDFKHFSHPHALTFHQMLAEAATETPCSGCNLHGLTAVYMCWECQFFLHDYCFQATRSVNHPSHSSHPLSLLPYPTYPSNSFICNSCNFTGTGFSYSCPNCEFDLHIHCAQNTTTSYIPHEIQTTPISYPPPPPPPPDHITTTVPSPDYPSPAPTQNFNNINFPNHNYNSPIPTQDFNNQLNVPHQNYSPSLPQNFNTQYPIMPENVPHQTSTSNTHPLHFEYNKPNEHISIYNATPAVTGSAPPPPPPPRQPQGVKHFSHDHPLDLSIVKESNVVCSGCEREILGSAYRCVNTNCKFNLHQQCFGLPRELQHKSHQKHPLALLTSPPYKEGFTCNACLSSGTAFSYHCATCKYDLHADCAFVPETMKRKDHSHTLSLIHSLPDYKQEEEGDIPTCDVCQGVVDIKNSWFYLCQECDFGTHLDCVNAKATPQTQKTSQDLLAAALLELQVLELRQKLSKLNADFELSSSADTINNLGKIG